MKNALGRAGQVLSWLVVLAVLAVLAVAVVVPRVTGATPYTVLTGSMEPAYPPGTLVVVRPVPPEELGTGDVVTYQLESGEAPVATHRVVAVSADLTGEISFTTQGDANDAPDPQPVRPVQVKGELWYSVPYLGHVNNLLSGSQRQVAVYLIGSLLLGYAAFMFTSSVRDRKRSRCDAASTGDGAGASKESLVG